MFCEAFYLMKLLKLGYLLILHQSKLWLLCRNKDVDPSTFYRTALIRAVGCFQLELDAEGKSGVHMYAVHPGEFALFFCLFLRLKISEGGVKTALAQAGSSVSDDMDKMTPGVSFP